MRLRKFTTYATDKVCISVKKDNATYKSSYSVCILQYAERVMKQTTLPNREAAKREVKRLLSLHTNLSKTEINLVKL